MTVHQSAEDYIRHFLDTYEDHELEALWTFYSADCTFPVLTRFGIDPTWDNSKVFMTRFIDAMAEAFNSLFKPELVRNRGPWKNIDDLEIAVAEYIDWFNFRRFHGEIGLVPTVEYETTHRSTALSEQPVQREFDVSIKPGT